VTPAQYLAKLRALCRRLPGTSERSSFGHPNFAAGGRLFAAFEVYRGIPSIAVLATKAEQSFLLQDAAFYKSPYVGSRGWVSADLRQQPPWPLLAELLQRGHALALAPRPRKKRPRAR
jgi:predicted DNA-binding protein (MmcQ/YjbR family)